MNKFYTPQERMLETLYKLDGVPEDLNFGRNIAVIGGEIHEGCAVFRDLKTDNRIVLTRVRTGEDDFSGASVSISNPTENVSVSVYGEELSLSEVELKISPDLTTELTSPDLHHPRNMSLLDVLRLVEFPSINPVPVDENDPRQVPMAISQLIDPPEGEEHRGPRISPTDFDILATPHGRTYTRVASIMDPILDSIPTTANEAKSDNVKSILEGVLVDTDGNDLHYTVTIQEDLPFKLDFRATDFDRQFELRVKTERQILLGAYPLGVAKSSRFKGNVFSFSLLREGSTLNIQKNDKNHRHIPTDETVMFLQMIIQSAEQV